MGDRTAGTAASLVLSTVAILLIASAPPGPATAGPCSAVQDAAAVGTTLCYNGQAVATYDAVPIDPEAGSHGDTSFITFHLSGQPVAVVQDGHGPWSNPLPAGDTLATRTTGQPDTAPSPGDRFVLAHLATPMTSAWTNALEAAGYTIHAYMPTNWFVVGTAGADRTLATFPFVDRVAGLTPELKRSTGLDQAQDGPVVVNALAMPGAPGAFAQAVQAIEAHGGQVLQAAPGADCITAHVPGDQLEPLADAPAILWLEQGSTELETDMAKIRTMTGATALETAPPGIDGRGVVGMVMDNGLDADHQDFAGSLLAVNGPSSTASHGTSTFGIVFGTGEGRPTATGMAPEADGVFAWWNAGSRYSQAEDLATIWDGVFQSHSWGTGVPKNNAYGTVSVEMDRIALELDVLPLQSMSNCGPQCARQEAMAKNILSVGALYHQDTEDLTDDEWADGFSQASTGPADDGRTKPELVGPYDWIETTTVNGYTTGFGGTSGATPVVAGAVALTHDMVQEGVFEGLEAPPSPAMTKALLIASAQSYLPTQLLPEQVTNLDEQTWRRDVQGWGLPALETLHSAAQGALTLDEIQALSTGETFTTTYQAPADATELRISLVWTDAPGSPGASQALVNDLDLVVRNSDGTAVYRGNAGLGQAPFSVPSTGVGLHTADRVNNVENVFLPLPASSQGPWTIEVQGTAVNLDADPATGDVDQPFALIALPIR